MNKLRFFILITALVLIVISIAGCSTNEPALGETQPESTVAVAATTAANASEESGNAESTDSSEIIPEFSLGENDLEIITVPQDNTNAPDNTQAPQKESKPVAETTEAQTTPTTEVQRIELPFVPVD